MIKLWILQFYFLQSKSITKESDGTMTYETTAGVFKGFDCVLFAVGRTPNTDLCLDKAVSFKFLWICFLSDSIHRGGVRGTPVCWAHFKRCRVHSEHGERILNVPSAFQLKMANLTQFTPNDSYFGKFTPKMALFFDPTPNDPLSFLEILHQMPPVFILR